jgi:hypothetical protein
MASQINWPLYFFPRYLYRSAQTIAVAGCATGRRWSMGAELTERQVDAQDQEAYRGEGV